MSDTDILAKINSVSNWYHQIEVRPGIITPGTNNSQEALKRLNLPEDCAGLRVLDLGARDGFYSFEFEKRGAAVTAVDYFPPDISGFNVAAELLNSKVTFIQDNIYTISKKKYGTFDIVLFLGLLYHMRDPLLALDNIRELCSNLLYLETYVIDNSFSLTNGSIVPLNSISEELRDIPIMQFYSKDSFKKSYDTYWGPNAKCVELMLIESNYSIIEKNLFGDRAVFKCKVTLDDKLEYFNKVARDIIR
jgi:tRNA (mo5U34)-methyltransferase